MKSVDILAEELAQARARGAVFSVLRRVRPWGLAFGGQRPLTAHVLVEGDGWLGFSGHEPIRLHERDAVLMTAGSPYKIVSEPGGDAIPISRQGPVGSPRGREMIWRVLPVTPSHPWAC
jgi:hypothetical protein